MARGGRPQADTEARRDSLFAVRLTATERAQLDTRAAAAGMSPADFARTQLVAAAARTRRATSRPILTADELRELNRVGVNLNQVSRALNFGTSQPVHDDLAAVLAKLDTIFARYLP